MKELKMKKYKCTKVVQATPMNRLEAEERGLVRDETGVDEPGYHVIYNADYESWSPKEPFDEGYEVIG